ncbi:MAG: aspartate/glutamate racemase family protein [Pyramidobacter sp.]|jgi:aspartate racemase
MVSRTVLGVFGGMGPAASAEFMRLLAALAPASCDQEHPVVYVYDNPQIPDRSTAIMGKGPSPEPQLREGLMKLCSWGAGLLAVPCNTAHYFIDHFRAELPVPLVHIVEATVADAVRTGPEGCWLIATGGTLYSGMYDREAERRGLKVFHPADSVLPVLAETIRLVKAGRLQESGENMRRIAAELWAERDIPIMCACTELPLAYEAAGLPQEREISSLRSLALACLRQLYSGEKL